MHDHYSALQQKERLIIIIMVYFREVRFTLVCILTSRIVGCV